MRPPTPAWRIVIEVLRVLVASGDLTVNEANDLLAKLDELEGMEEIETP